MLDITTTTNKDSVLNTKFPKFHDRYSLIAIFEKFKTLHKRKNIGDVRINNKLELTKRMDFGVFTI